MRKIKLNDEFKKAYPKSGLDGKTGIILELRIEIDGSVYVVSPAHVDKAK